MPETLVKTGKISSILECTTSLPLVNGANLTFVHRKCYFVHQKICLGKVPRSEYSLKKLIAFLLVLLTLPCLLKADEVLWPLAIDISQSSSFAEFRGMRFHAGIDLRTRQKNGFPVRAIADGFISRASVQFRGYGYALYIDHPQLKTRVVYGHLQDFSGQIKNYIDTKLKKMGQRHGINDFFTPERFPVKKGQIVALSGDTGNGPSHLHFEMRTLNDEPLAPGLFGYRPEDKIFPSFHWFYVEPMAHQTVIDGSFLPARFALEKSGKSTCRLASSPVISGKVALQAGISDTNGAGNRYGVEKITLKSGDKTLVERLFHQYSYDENRQCPWVYDYFKSNEKNTGYVYNLFKWPFDTLPFARQFPAWSGFVDSSEFVGGRFNFEILAYDYGNNKIQAAGALVAKKHDFSRQFSSDVLVNYKMAEFHQTNFSLVAVGYGQAKDRSLSSSYGTVRVEDKAGKASDLSCILRTDRIEIAFDLEPRWQAGAWLEEQRLLPETVFVDSRGGEVAIEKGARAVFPAGSLNFPVFAALRPTVAMPAPGGNAKRGWLKPFSAIWHLTPDNVVFNSEARVGIVPQNYNGDMRKLGVYNVNGEKSYSHNGEKNEGGALTFSVRTGGRYVILEDLLAPVLNYTRQTTHYHLGKCYVFKVSDVGKGVDYLSARAEINGSSTEVYSDPDKAEIYVVVAPSALPHLVKLHISDQAGNIAEVSRKIKN